MFLKVTLIILAGVAFFFAMTGNPFKRWKKPKKPFPPKWRTILNRYVNFYKSLNKKEQQLFEYKVKEFIINCKITGVDTSIDDTDKVLVGASAVIPIFAFPEWKYKKLNEVLIYPSSFNIDYERTGEDRPILGMVGSGVMNRKMILSRRALRQGFQNETDKRNTAIHEFIHILDKEDGAIDGIPQVFLEKQYCIPWIDMIEQKLEALVKDKADIHPYAQTSRIEFFAVLAEYFFERPLLLRKKHPKLYELLEEIFDQDLAARELKWRKK